MTKSAKINLILLFSILCNILVFSTTFYDAHKLKQEQARLSQIVTDNTELLIKLHELERTVGYSGYIHHFKNYVIRRDHRYFHDAKESYVKAQRLMQEIREMSSESDVVQNLALLEATLNEYNFNLETHFSLPEQLTVDELDRLVKVDDTLAANAVNNIVEKVLPKIRQSNNTFLNRIETQLFYSYLTSAMICLVIIIFTGLVIWHINKLNQSVGKFGKLFDASPDGIIHADNSGKVLAANHAAQTLFGYSSSEFSNKFIEDLMARELKQTHQGYRQEFTTKTQSKNMLDRRNVYGVDKQKQRIPLQIAIGSFLENDEFQSVSILRDMREIAGLNQELKFLSSIINGLSSYVVIINEQGQVITANYDLQNDVNEQSVELANTQAWQRDPTTKKQLQNAIEKLKSTGVEQRFDSQIWVDELFYKVDVVVAYLDTKAETGSNIICSAHDISERKYFEQQLLENEERFKLVVNHVSEGIILFNQQGRIDWLNAKAIAMLSPFTQGLSPCNFIDVFTENDQREIATIINDLTTQNPTSEPFQALLALDNESLPVEVCITRYADNMEINYLATVSDVSELLAANDRLSNMLEEKSILLNEIHHRVKNNLQVITSLLKLQQQHVPESAANELLACQQRIRSVALVHQLLYEQENSSKINFVEYTAKLAQLILLDGINHAPYKVELQLPSQAIYLPISIMVPIGFVINEVLTNIQKHAFPEGAEKGLITIFAEEVGEGLDLLIKDNGTGFDIEQFNQASSLGHTLIGLFTKQANGTIKVESELGKYSHFQFHFDLSYVK
ncbi:PAS domain S-box protein [Pseudoalteromonas sp. MMG024]|uniref:PAS domain-containing sensor histidine kinase n=1 Tax=Pseudoalteromonas sp. MMG024 TaxID=2909980 RepID=UPI001F3A723C|nr:PAS domain S-box protein [Pseudoalteromonas sp. MMG024]MCF6459200.1 PAS domain S-box protein [Pseudoalteromonas sp. MMG024]